MPATLTNWVHEKGTVSERDKIALKTAKEIERKDIENGFRWIKINERTKILVECDTKGNPTEKGKKKINTIKAL